MKEIDTTTKYYIWGTIWCFLAITKIANIIYQVPVTEGIYWDLGRSLALCIVIITWSLNRPLTRRDGGYLILTFTLSIAVSSILGIDVMKAAFLWVFTALVEEVMFRAIIISFLSEKTSNLNAVIISSLLYTFAHIPFNSSPIYLTIVMILGLVLGGVWVKANKSIGVAPSTLITTAIHSIVISVGIYLGST